MGSYRASSAPAPAQSFADDETPPIHVSSRTDPRPSLKEYMPLIGSVVLLTTVLAAVAT